MTIREPTQDTMLMVPDQMGFVREFADRVCFFYQGMILEQGSPDRLFNHPQTERTQFPESRA